MATIEPSVINSPKETMTSKGGYLRLTITSISDSDATTNKRYISCKLTIEGTRWVGLYRWASTLGGQTVSTETRTVEDWYPGHVLGTKSLTFDNDSAGNLSLTAYIKHIFYKGSGSWDTSYAKSITQTCVCSQLPRYANFTSHSATSTLNTITVSYAADANYTGQQYSLDGGSWTNCSAGSYTLTGFTPGSTHTIKTRIYRSDSGLETQSSQISVTLKSLPTSNTPSNTNFNSNGTSVTGSISNTDYLSGWYIIVKDGNNEIINGSDSKSTATSKSWSCSSANATAMLSRHGSNNSWSLSVEYYVVSNGTTYQLTTRTCTCTLPSGTYLPTFTNSNLSYEVTNSTSNNITGSNQKVIKGISVVRAKYTAASPQGGASMSSYLATSGTKSGSSNASTLYADINGAVDASSFSVQATDSRGRSTVASKDYTTYIDYFAPYTNSGGVNIARVDGVGANIRISISGKYKYWSGLQNPNTITQVSVKYKLKSSSTYNNININLSISYDSSNNFTATGTTTGDLFDIGNEYDVQVILKDVFNNLPINVSIPTGTVLMWKDLANNRIGIGKKPAHTLDINGDANIAGKVYIPKGSSYGIYNSAGKPIIRDHNNTNVTVDATDGTLFLGYQNTTGINILNGKATINSNGVYSGAATKLGTTTVGSASQPIYLNNGTPTTGNSIPTVYNSNLNIKINGTTKTLHANPSSAETVDFGNPGFATPSQLPDWQGTSNNYTVRLNYVKVQIAFIRFTQTATIGNTWGSGMFTCSAFTPPAYQRAFASAPMVSVFAEGSNSAIPINSNTGTASQPPNIQLARGSKANSATYTISIIAIGYYS